MSTLATFRKLPKQAGLAKLVFETGKEIGRNEKEILLPYEPDAEFHSLQNGRQFLFAPAAALNDQGSISGKSIWFGGTDEQPFLVEMLAPAYQVFLKKGARGFYHSLKPKIISILERRFGVKSRRQGDIWAVPVPYSREEVNFLSKMFGVYTLVGWFGPVWRQNHEVFYTRHRLTGYISYDTYATAGDIGPVERAAFAEGTIVAPDHEPLVLEGMHMLVQTRLLANPNQAD